MEESKTLCLYCGVNPACSDASHLISKFLFKPLRSADKGKSNLNYHILYLENEKFPTKKRPDWEKIKYLYCNVCEREKFSKIENRFSKSDVFNLPIEYNSNPNVLYRANPARDIIDSFIALQLFRSLSSRFTLPSLNNYSYIKDCIEKPLKPKSSFFCIYNRFAFFPLDLVAVDGLNILYTPRYILGFNSKEDFLDWDIFTDKYIFQIKTNSISESINKLILYHLSLNKSKLVPYTVQTSSLALMPLLLFLTKNFSKTTDQIINSGATLWDYLDKNKVN